MPAFYFKQAEEERAQTFALAKARLVSESLRNALITAMLEGRGQRFTAMLDTITGGGLRSVELLDSQGNRINRHLGISNKKNLKTDPKNWTENLYTDIAIRRQNACLQCHPDSPDPLMAIMRVTIDPPSNEEAQAWARMALLIYAITVLASALLMTSVTYWLYLRDRDKQEALILSDSNIKAEKLANINEFASSIAHDIKNPLAGISGAIQVFAEDFPKDDSRSEIIREVVDEIEKLDRSVKDLLSYARPPEPSKIPVLVDDLLDRAINTVTMGAKNQNVDVTLNSDVSGIMVEADPELIQQALLNVMAFGLQAMPEGGKLMLTAYVKGKAKNDLEITISDTGEGLDSEELKALFTPFKPSRRTGVGLGLAISLNVMERHRGTISAQSSQGNGTAFCLTLPVYNKNG